MPFESWKRPKIHIPKTTSEKVWDMIGFITFFGSIILVIFVWGKLPDEIPAHFNFKGEVDRWGSKWEIIILPIIGFLTVLFMQFFEKHPEWHNYPKRFNESNARDFYLVSRRLLNQLKNVCLIIFCLIMMEMLSLVLGWGIHFGIWLLPIIIVATTVPIIIGIIKMRKIQ